MPGQELYKNLAKYYDKIYSKKDYRRECEFIEWITQKKQITGNLLLDVACGTGSHVNILKNKFKVMGLDINKEMIDIARQKSPDVEFIEGDMQNLNIDKRFDIITCLFSAMNYNLSLEDFKTALQNFYSHLKEGGLVIFDLGINKNNWVEGRVSVDTVVEDNLKLARICQSHLEDNIFHANFVFLIKEKGKVDFDIDCHDIGVFEVEQISEIMKNTGFSVSIYREFSKDIWNPDSGQIPVFVGLK
ncbi:MAG: class I SAM-dependent methyltransferase [Euryarchaeota archaeon]